MSVYDAVRKLGITVPKATAPVASFVPFVRTGDLVFISGHIAKRDGQPWVGRLGSTVTIQEGQEAARRTAIDLIGTLEAATSDLDKVKRILRLLVFVNSAETFTEQHLVANGASRLFEEVFGDAGAHVRSAVGVSQLPFGACVEIELTAEVE
jgi:enamine deaminase RidA (YjgF/YER057c/UK114 family)